jgi:hypothetical protein
MQFQEQLLCSNLKILKEHIHFVDMGRIKETVGLVTCVAGGENRQFTESSERRKISCISSWV